MLGVMSASTRPNAHDSPVGSLTSSQGYHPDASACALVAARNRRTSPYRSPTSTICSSGDTAKHVSALLCALLALAYSLNEGRQRRPGFAGFLPVRPFIQNAGINNSASFLQHSIDPCMANERGRPTEARLFRVCGRPNRFISHATNNILDFDSAVACSRVQRAVIGCRIRAANCKSIVVTLFKLAEAPTLVSWFGTCAHGARMFVKVGLWACPALEYLAVGLPAV